QGRTRRRRRWDQHGSGNGHLGRRHHHRQRPGPPDRETELDDGPPEAGLVPELGDRRHAEDDGEQDPRHQDGHGQPPTIAVRSARAGPNRARRHGNTGPFDDRPTAGRRPRSPITGCPPKGSMMAKQAPGLRWPGCAWLTSARNSAAPARPRFWVPESCTSAPPASYVWRPPPDSTSSAPTSSTPPPAGKGWPTSARSPAPLASPPSSAPTSSTTAPSTASR